MNGTGSQTFETYTNNVRRLFWADFIDSQLRATRERQFRASIVQPPIPETNDLINALNYHRHRTSM